MTPRTKTPSRPASGNRIGVALMSGAGALILGITVGLWTDDANPYSVVYRSDAAPVRATRVVHRTGGFEPCRGGAGESRYERPLRPRV